MKKKLLSILLAITVAATMSISMPTAVFADHNNPDDTEKNILVFGASTSTGYGLSDFINENASFAVQNNDISENSWSYEAATEYNKHHSKRGRISEESYPWKLKKYIADEEFGGDLSKVDLSSMALNGMRTDELHALLDEDYYEAVHEWEMNTTVPSYNPEKDPNDDIGFLSNHIKAFVSHLGRGGAEVNGEPVNKDGTVESRLPGGADYRRASAYTKAEIKNADVIVVDVCMNNFGTYLAERVAGKHDVPGKEYAMYYWKQKIEDNVGVSPAVVEGATKLKKTLKTLIGALSSPSAEEFLDSFIYCYADCITNFSAVVEEIREINPDAKIIAVGVYNTLDGINLVLGDQTIDFGDVSSKGFDLVNAYIKGMDKNCNNYYYADVSGGIETFMNQIRNAETFEDLMADESGEFLMENMYSDFRSAYKLPDMLDNDPSVNYGGIKQGVEGNFQNYVALKDWNDLGTDEKVAGVTYVAINGTDPYVINEDNKEGVTYLTKQGLTGTYGDDAPQAYEQIKAGIEGQFQNKIKLKEWNDLADTEHITGTTYVICTGVQDNPYDVVTDPKLEGTVYLTKDKVPGKEVIQKLLYNAGTITDIHLDRLMEELQDMDNITKEIQAYILQGKMPGESTMELLHVVDRFILYMGVGQHPSLNGCRAMADDVLVAYQKLVSGGNTAYEDMKEEIEAMLAKLKGLIDGTPAGDQIDEIIETIAKIKEALPKLEEALPLIDEAKEAMEEYKRIKGIFEEYLQKALDVLDMTVEELIAKIKDVESKVDWKEMVDWVKTFDEMISEIQLDDETKAMMKRHLEEIRGMIQDKSGEIAEQINEMITLLKDLIGDMTIQEIMEELQPIFDHLKDIAVAAWDLPEYAEALEALDALIEENAQLKDAVNTLKAQVARLAAKSVDVKMTTKLTFPKKKAKVTLKWAEDFDADGYELRVNGKKVSFTEKGTTLVYTHNVKIGKKYKYTVRPYALYEIGEETGKVYGKTFTKTFTPKVKLTKGTIKSVKGAKKAFTVKWKKVAKADGYQVYYKAAGQKAKKKAVAGAKKVSKKIKKLAGKKTYTVKVRAYKTVNGKKYFGKWSKAKKVSTK